MSRSIGSRTGSTRASLRSLLWYRMCRLPICQNLVRIHLLFKHWHKIVGQLLALIERQASLLIDFNDFSVLMLLHQGLAQIIILIRRSFQCWVLLKLFYAISIAQGIERWLTTA